MGIISQVISSLWTIVHLPITVDNLTFTLFDVFVAGLILSLVGLFIGKIIFFILNRR